MTPHDLKNLFSFFTTDEERFDALLDLGKTLSDVPQKGFNCVSGCASRVDLDVIPAPDGTKKILAQSDSLIVKGLLVILKIFYAHPKTQSIDSFFHDLGLDTAFSSQRQNGLKAIIEKIEKTSL